MSLASPTRLLARLLGAGLICTLAACDGGDQPLAPSAEPEASTPADDGLAPSALAASLVGAKIAYESRVNGNAGIWVMNGDGTGRKQLTTWSGDELEPAWSRDNKHLAFVRKRPDANQVLHWDVFLMDADGTHKHWARSTPAWFDIMHPSWSPDGKHLVTAISFDGIASYLATMDLATGSHGLGGGRLPDRHGRGLSELQSERRVDPVRRVARVEHQRGVPERRSVCAGAALDPGHEAGLVARRQEDRLRPGCREQHGSLRADPEHQRREASHHQRPVGREPDLVEGRQHDPLQQQSERRVTDLVGAGGGGTQTRVAKTTSWDDAPALTF